MLRTSDLIAWVFPFLGVALVFRGSHVIFITMGSVAGCVFKRISLSLRGRYDEDRKVREIDRDLVKRMLDLEGVPQLPKP